MRNLSVDIETRSSADISKTGSYRYAQDPDFKILLFAYAFDDEDVQIIDLEQGEQLPEEVITALSDPTVVKHAYNAAFEWWCLNTAGYATPLEQWQCTMIHGLYCGYTAGLDATGKAIGLPQDKQKLTTGKALIRYFCVPRKPTKTDSRPWNLPKHAPEKWALFKEYCCQDVVTEREIWRRVKNYPVPDSEWHLWHMDVAMNAFGVRVDEALVTGALDVNERSTVKLTEEAVSITGLANPNSPTQLLEWINGKGMGVEMSTLDKEAVKEALSKDIPDDVRRILEIRQRLGKTSIKKYTVMQVAEGPDHRVRGVSQFYGANRTGRWAGRLLQLQNCTKNHIDTIDFARKLVSERNLEGIEMIYGDVQDLLSQLVRTALIPSEGRHFVVADFSAIEARVIGWLGGEDWVNEEFAGEGKIYEATAAQMFGVPKEKIKKGNPEYALRQKGKVATLALGYQGGTSALVAMGALKMGIPEDELPDIVDKWRNANPNICKLWYDMDKALHKVMQTAQPVVVKGLTIALESDIIYGQCFLTITLPTGRKLFYPKPHMKENRFGRQALHYFTQGQITRKWEVTSTYGGKVTENCVQAIARDCLAEVLLRIEKKGWNPVFHVHDEVIVDAPMDVTAEDLCNLMAEPIPWAPGLVLRGAGFESMYYMKD